MWIIGPEVPDWAFRFTPGEPVQWVLPADFDGMAAPVVEFAELPTGPPLPTTATAARTTAGRWAFTLDAATTALLATARRFRVRDGERSIIAGPVRGRLPFSPDVTTGDATYISGPQWVEESPGIWRA